MKTLLLLAVLGQVSYESMDDGERFLYHQLSRKIDELEDKLAKAARRQNSMDVRISEASVRIESIKEEMSRNRRELDALNAFKDNSLGRRTAEMGGVAGGTGLVIAIANYLLNRRLANKGGRHGSRG